ncbi:restriction endonuclease subunit S [Castellaniella sp. GW247-6E4]|uniref:restriction endonuclease subunit S n=1 Tax=Castellaniella sp. GW247-6E4 TaxID=3140380 RepID=UPI0033156FA2
MKAWETVELGQLAEFRNGLNYSAANAGSGLAVVGVSNFQQNSFVNFASLDELDPSALSTPTALIHKDDILFVRSNGNRELIGRSLFVLREPPKPTSHSGFTIRLRFTDERAYPRFFAYVLRGGVVRQQLSNQGGGTNINNLNQGILARLRVPIPPLETQHRISRILEFYDNLIEVNQRRIAVLEEMARGLFSEWFTHLRFPGYEEVPIKEAPDGRLPKGWAYVRLGSIASLNSASLKPATAPTKIGYIDIASVSPGRIDAINWMAFSDAPGRARRKVQDGSILWSNVRPNRRSFALVLNPISNVIASTGFTVLDSHEISFAYLYHWVTSDDFVGYLVGNAQGAAYPAVTGATFERAMVLLPTKSLVDRYTVVVEPMLRLIDQIQKANVKLAASRDLLLPRLISGQLSVDQAEKELEII